MRNLLKFQSNEAYQNYYESNNFVTPNISKIGNSDIKFIKEKINYVLEFTSKYNGFLYEKNGSIYFMFGDVYTNNIYFDKVIIDDITYTLDDCSLFDESYNALLDSNFDINSFHHYKLYINKETNIHYILEQIFTYYDNEIFNLTGNLILPNCFKRIGDPEYNPEYNLYCMYGLGDYTGDLIIPDSITYISNDAFKNCHFNNILIGSGIKTISGTDNNPSWLGGFTADSYNNMSNIKLKGLTNLGDYSLYSSQSNGKYLNILDLPSTITSIGNNIFGFTRCNNIIVRSINPPSLGSDNEWRDDESADPVIYVPDESVDLYKSTPGWSNFEYIWGLSSYKE